MLKRAIILLLNLFINIGVCAHDLPSKLLACRGLITQKDVFNQKREQNLSCDHTLFLTPKSSGDETFVLMAPIKNISNDEYNQLLKIQDLIEKQSQKNTKTTSQSIQAIDQITPHLALKEDQKRQLDTIKNELKAAKDLSLGLE